MPDTLTTLLGLTAYGCAGMAYLTTQHLTPKKIFVETLSGRDGSTLMPVFAAVAVAIGYPALLALWPLVPFWGAGERIARRWKRS
ncbi:hypothetical protein [Streptomyces sp. NPDC005131]